MQHLNQRCLFQVWPGEEDLDSLLQQRGYTVMDPVNIYTCPVRHLTDTPVPRVTVFAIWEPLAIMREIWNAGGVGPARQAIMSRAAAPKTGLLGRNRDKPGGAGFVAMQGKVAMVHAVEIVEEQRRKGLGHWMMRGAAFWAMDNGAETISVICTKANIAANGLYRSLGMQIAGQYHYRLLGQEGARNQ
ncbi:MAG: GNAT family N-acetyltransferase [Pseudomonadota bacterium]